MNNPESWGDDRMLLESILNRHLWKALLSDGLSSATKHYLKYLQLQVSYLNEPFPLTTEGVTDIGGTCQVWLIGASRPPDPGLLWVLSQDRASLLGLPCGGGLRLDALPAREPYPQAAAKLCFLLTSSKAAVLSNAQRSPLKTPREHVLFSCRIHTAELSTTLTLRWKH